MDRFPDVVRYAIRAGGCGARGFCKCGGDFFLAHQEVVDERGEVDVREGRGRGGREEVVEKGGIDAFWGVLVREGGEAGLLSTAVELFRLPY